MSSFPIPFKQPRRGAYLIPSLFTIANIFCGYFALMETFKGGQLILENLGLAAIHFDYAARAIGFAVLFDALDGRLARLMRTTTAFGLQLDSMADMVSFGIAPAFLAFAWGVRAVLPQAGISGVEDLAAAGWLVSFLFVICCAARLARFNIHSGTSPSPSPRPEHRNFVGLPSPAAAGLVAAIIHANSGQPVEQWLWVPFWLLVLLGSSLLMISTWRYYSFKDLDLRRRRKFVVVIGVATLVGLIWFYSRGVLLLIATSYLLSGIITKLSHALRQSRVGTRAEERKV